MIESLTHASLSGIPANLAASLGDRHDWLVSADRGRTLRNFRLDPFAAELVDFLSKPRTTQECRSRFSSVAPTDAIDAVLAQLSAHGLLETALTRGRP